MSTNVILLIVFAAFVLALLFFVAPRLIPVLTRQKATHDEAIKLGLTVEEVQEGAPTFSMYADPIRADRNEQIFRYSLKRIGTSPSHWSILPRLEMKGIKYPAGWLMFEGVQYPPEMWFLAVKDGAPSDCLKDFVKQLAREWTSEYLEFEGTPTEVRAYWHEWGGVQQARIIHEYLTALRRC